MRPVARRITMLWGSVSLLLGLALRIKRQAQMGLVGPYLRLGRRAKEVHSEIIVARATTVEAPLDIAALGVRRPLEQVINCIL